jgi:copper resistance protein C
MRYLKSLPLIAAAAMAISSVAVLAHAKMVSSTPTANATVAKPSKITMTFNQKRTGPTVKVELFMTGMPAGMKHDGGMDHRKMDHSKMAGSGMTDHEPMKIAATSQVGKDGKSVTLTPKRALSAGKYKVNWSAAGADMHKMAGSFSFSVK